MSKNTVIFSAPQGWGKTNSADVLKFIFECDDVIDDWAPGKPIHIGSLHLTHESIPADLKKALSECYGIQIVQIGHESPYPQTAERDPTGANPHTPGAKLDAGKNRLGLVMHGFPLALQKVGQVATVGAEKYTDHGWHNVPDGTSRYTDAMYRHLLAEASGEQQDRDTGLHHAAHAAWNALARLELILRSAHTDTPEQRP